MILYVKIRGVARGVRVGGRPPIVFKTVLVKSLNPVRFEEGGGGGVRQAAVHSRVKISVIMCGCVSCYCKNQISAREISSKTRVRRR